MDIKLVESKSPSPNTVYLTDKRTEWKRVKVPEAVGSNARQRLEEGLEIYHHYDGDQRTIICHVPEGEEPQRWEKARLLGYKVNRLLNREREGQVKVISHCKDRYLSYAFGEGLALSNYQFLKYKKAKDRLKRTLKRIDFASTTLNAKSAEKLEIAIEATELARDLVNEPLSFLTAEQLGKEVKKIAKKSGFKATVHGMDKVNELKMGGLLAVNQGSEDPPTFSIMEWKPAKSRSKKPIVLVGKGVVYDTGGLSLKPTPNSMDKMKSDMGGAAAVIAAMYAVARAELPIHVVGLVPATDNRPGKNAYVPGDVVTTMDGTTVEVLNTDAEGRMILADALSYAKRYDPALVIDLATLTGAAARAIGPLGIVYMGNADDRVKEQITDSGDRVYERLAEFPLWNEYGDLLKSDIADLKNIGGKFGGAITAGKFLQHFTDYPWLHLDIAGPAFLENGEDYRGKGGSGVGARLLFEFLSRRAGRR